MAGECVKGQARNRTVGEGIWERREGRRSDIAVNVSGLEDEEKAEVGGERESTMGADETRRGREKKERQEGRKGEMKRGVRDERERGTELMKAICDEELQSEVEDRD